MFASRFFVRLIAVSKGNVQPIGTPRMLFSTESPFPSTPTWSVKKFFRTGDVIRDENYVTEDEVKQIFGMAKILPSEQCPDGVSSFSIEEMKLFLTGMNGIVMKSKDVDVTGVEPMYNCFQDSFTIQEREDIPKNSERTHEELKENAGNRFDAPFFVIPKSHADEPSS